MKPRTFTAYDIKEVVDLLKDYTAPEFNGVYYLPPEHPYTPTGYINRTSLNGEGLYSLSDRGFNYHPRSRRWNPRWAARKRAILRGTV